MDLFFKVNLWRLYLVIGESGMFSLSIRIDAISLHIRKDFVSSTDVILGSRFFLRSHLVDPRADQLDVGAQLK